MSDVPPLFNALWFRLITGFVVGMALGSFGTMLWYRVPRGLSIVAPNSYCPKCKTPLGVPDLVPIFSWLWLRGKCRHCGKKIAHHYVMIELAVAVFWAMFFGLMPELR